MTKRNLALSLSFTLSLLLLGSFLLFMLDINTSHALAQSALAQSVPSALATTDCNALGTVQPISGLTAASVTAESGDPFTNAPIGNLTDEQQSIASTPPLTPTTLYYPGWKTYPWSPTALYIDLGEMRCLRRIQWFDAHDQGTVSLTVGSPGNWQPLTSLDMSQFLVWRSVEISPTLSRYVRLEFTNSPSIGEIAFSENRPLPTSTPHQYTDAHCHATCFANCNRNLAIHSRFFNAHLDLRGIGQ